MSAMHTTPGPRTLFTLLPALLLLLTGGSARADLDLSVLRELAKESPQARAESSQKRSDEAQAWYERARSLDRPDATPGELEEAADYYRRAAERGNSRAQAELGLMYLEGQGVQGNPEEAARWLRRAAESGDAIAQYSLALLYHQGHGVGRDFGEALYWYENAARQGNAGAMNNLAIMHGLGEGVPQSNVEAYAWFAMAASHGDRNAGENRDVTAAEMSEEDRRRAVERYQQLENQITR